MKRASTSIASCPSGIAFASGWLAVMLAVAPAVAVADDCTDTICPDRPDFVESSTVVGTGRFQIETGFQSETDHADGVHARTLTTPTLLRFGLADTLELRVETDGWTHERVSDGGSIDRGHGGSDASLGVKWHWLDGDGERGMPSVAWLVDAELPTGSTRFRGHGTRPSLRTSLEWELPGDWSVGVMPGIVRDSDDADRRYTAGILAVSFARSWTETVETYYEIAGQQIAAKSHGGDVVSADTGITWRVARDLQLDAGVARGLNHDTPDWTWTVGASVRF